MAGDPVLTVGLTMLTNLGWLAGRGYNIFRVGCEIIFDGKAGSVRGNLALVLWENHADPILTGREELGTPKLYATLPDAGFLEDKCTFAASWEGFRFAEFEVVNLKSGPIADPPPQYAAQGGLPLLCYRYHPKVGDWQNADIATMTMSTPGLAPPPVVHQQLKGEGRFAFSRLAGRICRRSTRTLRRLPACRCWNSAARSFRSRQASQISLRWSPFDSRVGPGYQRKKHSASP
ncbi:acetoacetate decarboxylase family protein [Bradyrhizobium sp. CCBAU 53421]|uniref:acetoacetate decarboxylase family protein n=1 Tax=Bradyrhizobium sp. CCBAU 53421 TaxID=1325120 RepID=UPI0035302955